MITNQQLIQEIRETNTGSARAAFSRLALEVPQWRLAEFSRVNH